MSRKVIITCALTGSATRREQNPSVPYTPAELAEAAALAFKAGAAMVHVHSREDDGSNTVRIERIQESHDRIKEKSPDLIVNLTSALGAGATYEQRLAQIVEIRPEMASLNMATMNFAAVNRKTGEIIADYTFENRLDRVAEFARAMRESGVKPEMECYSQAGIDNFYYMCGGGQFSEPAVFNLVMGVCGGATFRPGMFVDMASSLPPGSVFSACGVGNQEWHAITQSVLCGGHVRVGLEDNVRMPDGSMAEGNFRLVEQAVKIIHGLGFEIATPAEARKIFGLSSR